MKLQFPIRLGQISLCHRSTRKFKMALALICPICKQNLNPEDVSILKCGHTGHQACFQNSWMEEKDESNMALCHSCPTKFQPLDLQKIHLKFQFHTEATTNSPNWVQPSHKDVDLEKAIQDLSLNEKKNPKSLPKKPDGPTTKKKNKKEIPGSLPPPLIGVKQKSKSISAKPRKVNIDERNMKMSPRNALIHQPFNGSKKSMKFQNGQAKPKHGGTAPIPPMTSLPTWKTNSHSLASSPLPPWAHFPPPWTAFTTIWSFPPPPLPNFPPWKHPLNKNRSSRHFLDKHK